MDQPTLQQSLTVLENRYRELREICETRLQACEAEKADLKGELVEITHAKSCLETEIKKLSHLTDVLTSEKKDIEVRLQQASLAITGFISEKQDLESRLNELHLKSGDLSSERQQLQNELKGAREDLELRMLQLLQAQEELKHYFLKSQELASAHAQATQAVASTSDALQEVLASTSWRMTYPVRWALDQFHLFCREGYKKAGKRSRKRL